MQRRLRQPSLGIAAAGTAGHGVFWMSRNGAAARRPLLFACRCVAFPARAGVEVNAFRLHANLRNVAAVEIARYISKSLPQWPIGPIKPIFAQPSGFAGEKTVVAQKHANDQYGPRSRLYPHTFATAPGRRHSAASPGIFRGASIYVPTGWRGPCLLPWCGELRIPRGSESSDTLPGSNFGYPRQKDGWTSQVSSPGALSPKSPGRHRGPGVDVTTVESGGQGGSAPAF